MPQARRPNDVRSHARPTAPDAPRDGLPALALATLIGGIAWKSRVALWRFGSWLGIVLLRLNLPDGVAAQGAVKTFRWLVGHVVLGQGECPVLNLEDGEDHCA